MPSHYSDLSVNSFRAGRPEWSAQNLSSGYCHGECSQSIWVSMFRDRSARFSVCAILFCSLSFLSTSSTAGSQVETQTAAPEPSSTDAHPILLELFTSEGCSSCPPADALIEKLDHFQPVAGAHLIVLSEHVDYWDHDGWKDPNSSPAATERQVAYVGALGLKATYTPQIIVDGTTELHIGDPQQTSRTLHEAAAVPKIPVRIGEVTVDPGSPAVLRTRVEADGNSDKHNADVFVAVALDRVESQVLQGENGDRHLTHVAVVVQLTRLGKLKRGQSFDETVQLKLKPGTDPKNVRIVAFVQEPGPGRLLGAALRKPAS